MVCKRNGALPLWVAQAEGRDMGQLDVILRNSSTNTVSEIERLLAKLRVSGTVSGAFSITVPTNDEDRQDVVLQNIRNDPNVLVVGNAS